MRELLGPEAMAEAEPIIEDVLDHTIARIGRHLHSEDFAQSVEERASELATFVADQPVSDILAPGREAKLAAILAGLLETGVSSERFHQTVAEYLRDASERVLRPDLTLRDLLPPGVIPTMEHAIAGYIPLVIQRLGSLLERPATRLRLEKVTRDLLRRFLQDLRFHQRVVARFIINEETITKVFGTIQSEGAERIAGMFREQEAEEATAKGISDAISDLLDRPVTDVLGEPGDPGVSQTVETLAAWFVELVRDPAARDYVTERLEAGLARVSRRTWGELLQEVSPERASEWVVAAARTEAAATIYNEGVRRLAAAALERPIGPAGEAAAHRSGRQDPPGGEQAVVEGNPGPDPVGGKASGRRATGRAEGRAVPGRANGGTGQARDAPRTPHNHLPGLRPGGLHRGHPAARGFAAGLAAGYRRLRLLSLTFGVLSSGAAVLK